VTRKARSTSARSLLAQLGSVRAHYAGSATPTKLALLAALEQTTLHRAPQLACLHAQLLFLRAFPDNGPVLEAARHGLAQFGARVRRIPPRDRARLEDTGLAGSASRHTFEAPIAAWLCQRFPADVEIDWANVVDAEGLEVLCALVALRAEHDGLESPVGLRRWLQHARGPEAESALHWLMRQLTLTTAGQPIGGALYDQVKVPIIWRVRDAAGAATHNFLPVRQVAYRTGFRRAPKDPRRWIAAPLRRIRRLPRDAAVRVLDVTRAALTARCREVFALAHANPDEVYIADLGEGAALAVYGVASDQRLSLESNYGYLLLSNGVPIGYGGVTALFRQANTGINIFESFRGSEAAFLWAQCLRAFVSLFGVSRFLISPYQIGQGNSEAIASGAFWFYYRLGFRPVDGRLGALAAAEWKRQRARPRYRTPAAILRRLAGDDLELVLRSARALDRFPEAGLGELGLRASELLAHAGGPHRAADAEIVSRRVARALGARGRARWPSAERAAFTALAPLVGLLDRARIDARSRARLVSLMRAKGAPQERAYVRAAARNRHLIPGLMALIRSPANPRQRSAAKSAWSASDY